MTDSGGRAPVKSAGRVLAILDHIAEAGSASFAELLEQLDLPKSSGHGLLQTLQAAGWIEQNGLSRRYTLGLRTWELGQRYDGHRLLTETAKPVMNSLSELTGETVQLARLDGVENVYIAISPSRNPMRLVSNVGMRLPAHATGIGKALLSTLDEHEAEHRLTQAELARLTDRTITDVEQLLRAIGRVREIGYATDDEEYIDGCRCIAVPLTREADTGIPSAMSITMPVARTDADWPDSLYPALAAAAREVRDTIGLRAA